MLQYVSQLNNQQVVGASEFTGVHAPGDNCPTPLKDDRVHGHPHRTGNEIVDQNLFRVYYHNVNGLSTRDDRHDLIDFTQTVARKECAVVAITEPNRNFERPHVASEYYQAMRGVSSHHNGSVSSARLGWPRNYQPGGTAISVRNKWATRYLAKGADSLGRWSYITLAGKGTTLVTFIVAYRVCDGGSETPLTARTVRAQQEWLYADRGFASIDLRKQFLIDLTNLINKLQKEGHDIVLTMDANEGNESPTSGIAGLVRNTELVDVHASLLEPESLPATYQRGSTKIDYIFVTKRLLSSVRASSILPLNDGYLSDHRALVVDFDPMGLFGDTTSDIVPPATRLLTSTNPRAIHKYIDHIKKHIDSHRIREKIETLADASTNGTWSPKEEKLYNSICHTMATGRQAAEQQLAPKHSGRHPWSPTLADHGQLVSYWRMRSSSFLTKIRNTAQIKKMATDLERDAESDDQLSQREVTAQLRLARKTFKVSKRNAVSLREQHQEETAQLAAQLHGTAQATAQADIASRERRNRQYRQLRQILSGPQSGGLDRIEVPNAYAVRRDGEAVPRIPLVVKEEIEEVLVPHTSKRFRQPQTDGTPFSSGERGRRLGRNCDSEDANRLLDGTYDYQLEELTEEARTWMKHLKRQSTPAPPLLNTHISTDDWVSGWSKMRESTASAPSGHFGHYKTAAVAARLPEEHPDFFPDLASIYATLVSLPLKHGFAPEEWKHCVDAVLEKIPGRPIIEKLRIIMLFDAQFNFALKMVFGRRMIHNAEDCGFFGSENHGSRPGRQVQDALLEKTLMYEHARLTRTSLITVDNDAKSCYDRIIKGLALLACMATGLPQEAAAMHNTVHDEMTHSMKTRHGLLRPYCGTDEGGSDGAGQGSGAAGAIWLVYSNSLISALHEFSPGITQTSPINRLLRVCLIAIFFVDDGTPGVNDACDAEPLPLPAIAAQAQKTAQSWERLLFASGGALEFSKCFAYIVYWDLSDGKHRLLLPDEIEGCEHDVHTDTYSGPIQLTYGDLPGPRKIATESPWKGRRTLGVRIAPGGSWTDEFQYRRQQSHELSLRLAGAHLDKDTARLGYATIVNARLEFPLTVTQFTQAQCDKISSPVLNVCMAKMGYNRNMPREVVYGPLQMGGLGLHDLYIEQGIKAVTALVGHLREPASQTAKMMLIELQWCQVQAGTSINLLAEPHVPIDYIESCWIMHIRSFLATYNLSIDLTQSAPPVLSCEHDAFIMDQLRTSALCTAGQLQQLNACRLYLRVQRLSEITVADGTALRKEALRGIDSSTFSSTDGWPRQGRPPKKDWQYWSKMLRAVFSSTGNNHRLRTPLGKWYPDVINPNEWHTVASLTDGSAYRKRDDGSYDVFEQHTTRRSSRHRSVERSIATVDSPPSDVVPADIGKFGKQQWARVTMRECVAFPPPRDDTYASFADFLSAQPAHLQETLSACDLSDDTVERVAQNFYENDGVSLGTDGGLLACIGTYGFAMGDALTQTIWTHGGGSVSGYPSIMSSTRAELGGIFAALTYIRLILQYKQVVDPDTYHITLFCDSTAALAGTRNEYLRFGTTWRCCAHYDYLSAIEECVRLLDIPITWSWVRGHASKRKPPHEFTWAETLNEAADEQATHARTTSSTSTGSTHWPEQHISVSGPSGRLRGHLAHELRYCCTNADLLSYWKDRYDWTDSDLSCIDLTATKVALSKLPPARTRRIQKLRCGWLPVNSRLSREQPDCLSPCAACSPAIDETVDHVFQCPSNERRSFLHGRLKNLPSEFQKWGSSALISRVIIAGASAWIEQREPPDADSLRLPDDDFGLLVRRALAEQTLLGWSSFFRGFWTDSWRIAHQYCYEHHPPTIPARLTGERWSGKAQRWFYSLFDDLWNLRNKIQHGADPVTQRQIRLAKCERAIRRLYAAASNLPYCERHPFRDSIETLLSTTLFDQELWISKTETYLPKAYRRAAKRGNSQPAITEYFHRLPRAAAD